MVDIVVRRADGPDVILTLDKRFVETPTLELLHTSASTVVRKVTRIWPGEDDFVNLHRQSVTSLMPALGQATVWGVFALLATFARGIDADAVQRAAMAAAGGAAEDPAVEPQTGGEAADPPDQTLGDEIVFGADAIAALTPVINGPAIQILRSRSAPKA